LAKDAEPKELIAGGLPLEQDPRDIEAFNSPAEALKAKAVPIEAPIEIWFQDEMRVG
jgi:hypothetical protein